MSERLSAEQVAKILARATPDAASPPAFVAEVAALAREVLRRRIEDEERADAMHDLALQAFTAPDADLRTMVDSVTSRINALLDEQAALCAHRDSLIAEREDLLARRAEALNYAADHGWIDGDHHKMWVIDQMARELLGDKYPSWADDNDWDEDCQGIAP